ncbi:MAG: SpoIIIAH-like family protein [Clostridia bacterium]
MTKTKKIIIIVSMVLVLAVAACLNILFLNKDKMPTDNVVTTGNFFMSHRLIRQNTRLEEMHALEEVIALQGTEYAKARNDAIAQKMKLVKLMETELVLESLIKAKGYEDVVINMGLYSNNINVMVKCESLKREDTAIIYSVIVKETGISPDLIKMVPV